MQLVLKLCVHVHIEAWKIVVKNVVAMHFGCNINRLTIPKLDSAYHVKHYLQRSMYMYVVI